MKQIHVWKKAFDSGGCRTSLKMVLDASSPSEKQGW